MGKYITIQLPEEFVKEMIERKINRPFHDFI